MSRIAVIAAAAVTLALAVASGGQLTGCATSTGASTTSSGDVTTSTTLAPATTSTAGETTSTTAARLTWGDTGKWQGVSVTAASPQNDPSPGLVDAGNKVVYCVVSLVNNSPDPFDYNGLDFILSDTGHQEYDNYGLGSVPDIGEGTLAPGESVSGAVAFELPQAAVPAGLKWQPRAAAEPQLIWGEP